MPDAAPLPGWDGLTALDGLHGHVIVCGLHDVGLRVVEQLVAAGERVVVVDDNPNHPLVRVISGWDVGLSRRQRAACVHPRRGRPGPGVGRDLRRVRRPAEPRDRAARAPAAPAAASRRRADQRRGRTCDRPGHRTAHRARRGEPGRAGVRRGLPPAAQTHELDLGGAAFAVVTLEVNDTGSLRSLYGDLAPIAVVSGRHGRDRDLPGPRPDGRPRRSRRGRRHRGRPGRAAPGRRADLPVAPDRRACPPRPVRTRRRHAVGAWASCGATSPASRPRPSGRCGSRWAPCSRSACCRSCCSWSATGPRRAPPVVARLDLLHHLDADHDRVRRLRLRRPIGLAAALRGGCS